MTKVPSCALALAYQMICNPFFPHTRGLFWNLFFFLEFLILWMKEREREGLDMGLCLADHRRVRYLLRQWWVYLFFFFFGARQWWVELCYWNNLLNPKEKKNRKEKEKMERTNKISEVILVLFFNFFFKGISFVYAFWVCHISYVMEVITILSIKKVLKCQCYPIIGWAELWPCILIDFEKDETILLCFFFNSLVMVKNLWFLLWKQQLRIGPHLVILFL